MGLGGDPFVAAAVRDMTSSETRGSGGTTRPSTGASFSACVIGASPGRDEEGGDVCLVVWAFVLIALAAVVSLLVTLRGALDLEQWLHNLRVGGAGGLDFPDWVNGPNGSPGPRPQMCSPLGAEKVLSQCGRGGKIELHTYKVRAMPTLFPLSPA